MIVVELSLVGIRLICLFVMIMNLLSRESLQVPQNVFVSVNVPK